MFNGFAIPIQLAVVSQALEKQKMNVRVLDDKTLAASFDETHLEVGYTSVRFIQCLSFTWMITRCARVTWRNF